MFGIKSTDAQLLEEIMHEVLDVIEGKRNRYRYANASFSDRKIQHIADTAHHRLQSIVEAKQKDMLAMGELILALDQMKSGLFKPTNIEGDGTEVSVIANSFNAFTLLLSKQFAQIVQTLHLYASNDFTSEIAKNNQQGEMAALIDGVNNLAQEITVMLTTNLQNGLNLRSEASFLKQAMESLSTASN
ncbi:MAG TPA: hypothetical protein CFH83_06300, partial [Sulfuricurvum kujiense]